MNVTYLSKPEPGKKSCQYIINWTFTRVTNVTTYTYSSSEIETHEAYLDGTTTKDKTAYVAGDNIIIATNVTYPNGTKATGRDVLVHGAVQAIIQGDEGPYITDWVILRDDGHWPDETANDGEYTGNYSIKTTDYSATAEHPWRIRTYIEGSSCSEPDPEDVDDVDTPEPEVPEASTLILFALGLLCLAGYVGLKKRKSK